MLINIRSWSNNRSSSRHFVCAAYLSYFVFLVSFFLFFSSWRFVVCALCTCVCECKCVCIHVLYCVLVWFWMYFERESVKSYIIVPHYNAIVYICNLLFFFFFILPVCRPMVIINRFSAWRTTLDNRHIYNIIRQSILLLYQIRFRATIVITMWCVVSFGICYNKQESDM